MNNDKHKFKEFHTLKDFLKQPENIKYLPNHIQNVHKPKKIQNDSSKSHHINQNLKEIYELKNQKMVSMSTKIHQIKSPAPTNPLLFSVKNLQKINFPQTMNKKEIPQQKTLEIAKIQISEAKKQDTIGKKTKTNIIEELKKSNKLMPTTGKFNQTIDKNKIPPKPPLVDKDKFKKFNTLKDFMKPETKLFYPNNNQNLPESKKIQNDSSKYHQIDQNIKDMNEFKNHLNQPQTKYKALTFKNIVGTKQLTSKIQNSIKLGPKEPANHQTFKTIGSLKTTTSNPIINLVERKKQSNLVVIPEERVKNITITFKRVFSAELFKVKIVRNLCQGITSDVFLGEIIDKGTQTGKLVALKRFKGEDGRKLGETEKMNIEKLLQTKSLQKNPNFCKLLGYIGESGEYSYSIVLEYGKQTLYQSMKTRKKMFELQEIREFVNSMIFIFSNFQKMGLFYRDIKPANILISQGELMTNIDKIIDFDVSLWLDTLEMKNEQYFMGLSGTPMYMSP